MTRDDWCFLAIEIGVPVVIGMVFGSSITHGLIERYSEAELSSFDACIPLGLLGLVKFGWSAWQAAKKKRGRM